MAKKVKALVKIQIPAGQANPAPPVGTALGPHGVNIMEFCKAFNAKTGDMEAGTPIPVVITVYEDRSFTFITKTPPISYFLKKAAKLDKGSKTPGKGGTIGEVSMAQVREIAEKKMRDLNANDVEAASRMIVGSARSMGLKVVE